jgi:diphthine methyl ester synthase
MNYHRGRKIYEPPRYMSVPLAVNQLIEIEAIRQTGTLDPDKTLAVAVSRVGGDADQQRIVAGTLTELSKHPEETFGEPLHSLVVVGKRLHHLEVEYAGEYAVNKESWLKTAKDVYSCSLDD